MGLPPPPIRPVQSFGDEGEDESYFFNDEEYCVSARILAQVYWTILSEIDLHTTPGYWSYPPCARSYAKDQIFLDKMEQCALRILRRISLGQSISPNCTGEEIILYMARDAAGNGDHIEA